MYRFLTVCFYGILLALAIVRQSPAQTQIQTQAQHFSTRVILVGDSTMATKSGYGDALCARFQASVDCVNLARGGRSSGSFRAEGLWSKVQELLRQTDVAKTYVLIQFGHNDQPGKPGRSTDLVTEFPVNMARYVAEVKALSGVPVLVTPLTRRSFHDGVLENNLLPWAEASAKVAHESQIALLPLYADSYAAVQAMGEDEADTLAVAPPPPKLTPPRNPDIAKLEPQGAAKSAFDRTHVGAKGAAFFAAMVEQELKQQLPAMTHLFKDQTGVAK